MLLFSPHQDLWVTFTSELVFPCQAVPWGHIGPQPTFNSSLLAQGPSRGLGILSLGHPGTVIFLWPSQPLLFFSGTPMLTCPLFQEVFPH